MKPWISVKDKLPKLSVEVWVADQFGQVYRTRLLEGAVLPRMEWEDGGPASPNHMLCFVTHWKPTERRPKHPLWTPPPGQLVRRKFTWRKP